MLKRRQQLGNIALVTASLLLVTMLLFFSLSAGLQQYQLASKLADRSRARDLAESTIHLAIAELCRNPNWGTAPGQSLSLPLAVAGAEGQGFLSFDGSLAHAQHIPSSCNNLNGPVSTAGDGLTVPRSSTYLAALGRYRSERIQIETILVRPPYPTGCAARGPILMESVRLWGQPLNTVPTDPPNPNPWSPANVFTNRSGPQAMQIDALCDIFGDALAVGDIALSPGGQVRGELSPRSSAHAVPHLDIAAMWSNVAALSNIVPFKAGEILTSFVVVNADLNAPGDLVMDGGFLAVNGNLNIAGRLSGRGLVLATGNVTAQAGAQLVAENRLALLSGGDVVLAGQGINYHLSGLVYAQGKIDAHDLTVHGAVVQDDPTQSKVVHLKRINLIQDSIGVFGNIGLPLISDASVDRNILGFTQRSERFELHLQAYRDPQNANQLLFSGSFATGDNETHTSRPLWPPHGDDRAWQLNLSPPTATLQDNVSTHGGFDAQSRLALPITTTNSAYDGSEAQLLALVKNVVDTLNPDFWDGPNKTGRSTHQQIQDYINNLKLLQNTTNTWLVDLNNLLPLIESTRLVTWREGTPSR